MRQAYYSLLLIVFANLANMTSAQERIVFAHQQNYSAMPVSHVDSITMPQMSEYNLYKDGDTVPMVVPADTIHFSTALSDTLKLTFHNDEVTVNNPHLDYIEVTSQAAAVNVRTYGKQPAVFLVTGKSNDGRLIIDADTTCTIVLSDLQLSSNVGSCICLKQKQKAEIVLADGTTNTLSDAQTYNLSDTTDTSNACIYTKGSLTTFTGAGTLNISGNYRHTIASSKNITVKGGSINILATNKDGIHCDKYKQEGGTVELHIAQTASKGIKVKEEFEMKGGHILGEAAGDLKIADGETSYCTLIKSDKSFTMEGGEIQLKHTGQGGRCISVDKQLTVTGGTLDLECHGDGGSYLTLANDSDYYTPKCITVDESLLIASGNVRCLSTGLGGKGLVSGRYLAIGSEGEQDSPIIRVETKGECIINNEDEDLRFGCPKGIKAEEELHIYSGDIAVTTAGMGGEGVECNGEMYIHGGTLECNTFDDGINVGRSIEISGGCVYCNSVDNDGIDSNGNITIMDGIVASVNQLHPDESFDSEAGQLYLFGGIVFGIGSDPVEINKSSYPCYSTPYNTSPDGPRSKGLILTEGKYVYLKKGNEIVIAMKNENKALRTFVTVMSPSLMENELYSIGEGDFITNTQQAYFDGKLLFGGTINGAFQIENIHVQTIN